jgi:RNA polymerase sigma factor (sigma-70 family)
MAIGQPNKIIQHLRAALKRQDTEGMLDAKLLKRYVQQRDEAAFEALVRRHGPMVLGVCRRILQNLDDAEDAFQATFLVLVRKAASLRSPGMIGNWLFGVAHRTALHARDAATKRRTKEAEMAPLTPAAEDAWADLRFALDQELERLPEKYRAVIVLCDLEGKTRTQAARQLGWAEGTVASRVVRGRGLLAKRLTRHGLAFSGGGLATALSQNAASACIPASLVVSTVKAAHLFAAGQRAAAGLIPAKVAALTEGVLRAMLLSKLKLVTVVLLVIFSVIGTGLLTISRSAIAEDKKPEGPAAQAPRNGEVASVSAMAGDVFNVFDSNDALGDEKYTGKLLQVTGGMERVRRFGEKYVLTMIGLGDSSLWFEFDAKHRKKLAALGVHSTVTIRGQCDGRATVNMAGKIKQVIRFRNCEIVQARPDRGVRPK